MFAKLSLARGWQQPPFPPFLPLTRFGWVVVEGMGLGALPVLAVRYLGALAQVGRDADEPGAWSGRRPVAGYLVSLALTLAVLSSVIRTPVNALILLAGLLAARPVARVLLRATGLAPLLAAIARPIRLIAGFGVTLAFAWCFIAIVGPSRTLPFFHMAIAIAVGLVILEVFLAADDVAGAAPPPAPSGGNPLATTLAVGALLSLAFPAVARADNMSDESDIKLMAATAAASAAGAKAWDKAMKKKFPPKLPDGGSPGGGSSPDAGTPNNPPAPWWSPDRYL